MLEGFRSRLARWIAPARGQVTRIYASARASRLAGGAVSNSSADMELVTSQTTLRGRSRQLIRDASYAKNAKRIVQNNVIGTGIGLQSNVMTTRDSLNKGVNDAIEAAFRQWSCADNCHTGGALHFHDLERMLIGQVFEAGEIFVRLHPRAFGQSKVPLALEVIEPERIADEAAPGPLSPDNMVRMGIEVDRFYRPVRYLVRERHQGEFRLGVSRSDTYEWVPAEQILHLKITERWPQTRGEPWLHTVVRKLQDIDGYSEAEIVAARGSSNYFASLKSADDPKPPVVEEQSDGSKQMTVEPGIVMHLAPGEELEFHTPNRPNPAMDPFMRLMLREVAAGVGTSYESLSRDYSQSNYSSSRLALLDDRDLWRYVQLWFIRSFREPLHRIWLQQAVLARAIQNVGIEAYATDAERYCLARFKPRGWSWIDPTKEVEAAIKAVRAGFDDVGSVIGRTADGRDLEDVLGARASELEMMREKGLEFDTDPDRLADGSMAEKPQPKPQPSLPAAAKPDEEKEKDRNLYVDGITRVVNAMVDVFRSQKAPQAMVTLSPEIHVPAPSVNVKAGDVHIAPQSITVKPGDVRVDVQPSPAPDVHVDGPTVNVAPAIVHVAAPEVRVENKVEPTPVMVAAPAVTVENRVEIPAPQVTVSAPQVKVEAPEVRVEVAAPEVRIENKVAVAQETETETVHERDDRGELVKSRARTKVVR